MDTEAIVVLIIVFVVISVCVAGSFYVGFHHTVRTATGEIRQNFQIEISRLRIDAAAFKKEIKKDF